MNNIQKSFKKKSELRCMADGGKPPYPATEYDFATSHGGAIKGPGGPTDDKVGPVMLSNKEYVLPADTVKAIGKDKLDALRHATHKFVDSEPGGLANGGFLDEVTKRAKEGFSALRSAVTPAPAAPAPTPVRVNPGAGVDSRVGQAARGLAPVSEIPANRGMVPYQAATPSAAAPGRMARRAGGLRGLARGVAITAPVAGFGDYKADTGGIDTSASGTAGYLSRGEFGKAGMSLSGGAGEALADSVRGIAKTADGVAGIFGATPGLTQKADNAITGGYFSLRNPDLSTVKGGPQSPSSATPVADGLRGTGSPMAKEKPPSGPQYYADLERQHQQELKALAGGNREAGARAAAGGSPGAGQYPGAIENRSGLPNSAISGADPNSYYASLKDDAIAGSFNGRNYTKKELDARAAGLQTASGRATKPEGDPAMAEIRSALRGIGNGGGGGNWAPRSQADEINARYDALMQGGVGQNRVKGSDWSQRHGLDVEMARARELGADASNQSTLRGQNMQAGSAADQTRMSGITKMMELQAEREKAGGIAQAAAIKAQQDALKQAADANQQGYENFTKAAEQMFVGPEGKPDPAQQQQFMDFVSATDPKILEEGAGVSSVKDLFDLAPQEQMNAVQRLKTMMSMQAAANKSIGNATMLNNGPQQTGFDAPLGDAREGTWGDMASGKLSVGQWLYGNLPFTEKNVQPLTSGGVVPLGDYVGNNADAEKIRLENIRNKLKYNNQ